MGGHILAQILRLGVPGGIYREKQVTATASAHQVTWKRLRGEVITNYCTHKSGHFTHYCTISTENQLFR